VKIKGIALFVLCIVVLQFAIYTILDKPTVETIKIEEFENAQPILSPDEANFKEFFSLLDKELMLLKNSGYFKDFVKEDIYGVEVDSLFLDILKKIPQLYQLRYIDQKGDEIIRAQRNQNTTHLIPKNQLQNKKHRYYFKDIMDTSNNRMWLSKVDNNIENGIVDFPKKKTLRIGIPILVKNKKKGILIANVKMEQFNLEDGEFLQSFRTDVLKHIFIAF